MSNSVYDFFFKRLDAMQPLSKGLDAYAARQKTYAANIANSETPGYGAKRVEFEGELRKAISTRRMQLSRTQQEHIPVAGGRDRMERLQPEVVTSRAEMINGVNNVDIEREMSGMATNQIQFATASKVLAIRYRMLRSSIIGRSM
ncbi:MAG TPA: flagellar basal body rod protein FlgB [Bacteroidetes bacterium]|nr:flagellar basal body rod protein FlgB [Bacteroidota bacterium]HEX05169.1 flagellar basal body rod protein FlgB [Bacteroidota bacterium]